MSGKFFKLNILLFVLMCPVLNAQQLSVTATITDSDSQTWNNGTWSVQLVSPGGTPYYNDVPISSGQQVGSLSSSGALAVSLYNSSTITPAGAYYSWILCSRTSAPCSSFNTLVTTANLSSLLSGNVQVPRFPAGSGQYGYLDVEVSPVPLPGGIYYNVTTPIQRIWNGSAWVNNGGGSGAGCTGPTGNYSLSGQVATLTSGCVSAIGAPFGVSIACSAAGSFEIGFVSTNPNSCTFTYSNGTPASGTLGDGTNTVTLTTPYTSGSLAHTYAVNTTFTVNATDTASANASASDSISFHTREFGGIGTSGATGATASGTSAILVGATGTLASVGLGQQSTWGPYSPSNQNIYVLGTSSSCTFTSAGFAFPMNAPITITFVNQYSSSVTMYLYQSTNLLSSTFTLNGTC